jgi:uncharacterized Zn finger protein
MYCRVAVSFSGVKWADTKRANRGRHYIRHGAARASLLDGGKTLRILV